ncbi:helix-turn-helix domain-containing protein [Kocuria arenosa]|uniref:helix-turn-helix domain-containing protein n=1 Tax=Kocuria arenosa TaxID=3071446 RepID=UPI0034D40536
MPDPVPQRQYYSLQQVAQILTLHPETVRRYLAEGELPAVKVGGARAKHWRIRSHWLDRWADDNVIDPRGATGKRNRR